ncbi:helix-turn-helix domain-containing protein [Streptomyces pacificus]|uniref:Helix-turn-helix domain-containing protein n=1 Tax=Streptomyces pacificus TaxID=2705029 RepID=A0A6A0ATY3_9ACTN|nr:helix-turn-helix transcriptional regulator [Streptomyces pacificus]GFH35915.1 helix-turn-helix domain-containing protein [Streptomyces pacificus]
MLQEVWSSERLTYGGVAQELGVSRSTLQCWIEGKTVPSPDRLGAFLAAMARLRSGHITPTYSDAEWEAAVRAAKEEARSAQRGQISVNRRRADHGLRFIGLHGSAPDVSAAEVRMRANERTEMKAFAQDSRPGAPSYLCWHADGPVGKTTLLAGYVRQRPSIRCDILTFFVSAAHGADTRDEFENEIAGQIDCLLGGPGTPVPKGTRAWNALFAKAAEKSAKHGRNLLLVVDGLDDDVAWSGDLAGLSRADKSGVPKPRARSGDELEGPGRVVRRSAHESIAALLPSLPPPNMRIIVSLRRCAPLPRDVPEKRHPLRQSRHLRTLLPIAGVPRLRQPQPDATALGEPVAGLLAVADGGLRISDLAELTGLSADHLDHLVQGPTGRALVTEDPVLGTYALADSRLVQAVREDVGGAAVLQYTEELLLWSRRWCAAGWPDDTPPYPLAHQLRLLTGTAERASYVLDLLRLHRLARTAGPDIPLAQLDDFEKEIGAAVDATSADRLATLISLYGARSLLRQAHDTYVPDGAPALYARLGDGERARGLARSAPTAVDRAVHLADAAVELAYAGQPSAGRTHPNVDALVREAAEWLARDRAHQGFPGPFREPEPYVRLLCAAGTLARLSGPGAARPVFRAVLQDPAAGTAAITEAAGKLDAVVTLHSRAEKLSAGDLRARTAAVELYGALAQVAPDLGPYAGDRVEAVCEELGDTEGLGAVDVLATAASVLVALPAKRHRRAADQLRRALAWTHRAIQTLSDSESPSDALTEADSAHLRRELAGTLERLAEATVAMKAMGDQDGVRRQMEAVPEDQRVGILGDLLLERAQSMLDAAGNERARRAREAAQEAAEKSVTERRAKRRKADAERAALNEARMSRGAQATRAPQPTQTEHEDTRASSPSRLPDPHRRSAGLLRPGDGLYPDRPEQPLLPLLLEVDDEVGQGRLLRGRELLEAALRSRPAAQPASTPYLPEGWTAELCHAMGMAGASDEAEALVRHLPGTHARVWHLAALSLGCSLAGHDDPGIRHARAAVRLLPTAATPDLTNVVAQALAHAGDEAAATAMVTGDTAQRLQALTAVAAGLVRHCSEAAERVAEPLVEVLARRMETGTPRVPLPELAALLLAFPDVRNPAPRLRATLGRAVLRVAAPSMAAPERSMAVLALLERLRCLPDEAVNAAESAVGRWRRARQPGPRPATELALLAAVNGDTAAVWRHADAAPTPDDRATALGTAAAHLAGAQVAPAADSGAHDRVIRTCMALARSVDQDSPPAEETARDIALGLLQSDAWTRTIPLLPSLAPGALGNLTAMARVMTLLRTDCDGGPST